MKIASRIAAALVALVAAVLVTPSPAHATRSACSVVAGSHANDNAIYFCVEDIVEDIDAGLWSIWLRSMVEFDAKVTAKTTKCKVTLRAVLENSAGAQWATGRYTEDCTKAVEEQGQLSITQRWHTLVTTGAKRIDVQGCIDLYFNGSTSSGRQICKTSGMHDIALRNV